MANRLWCGAERALSFIGDLAVRLREMTPDQVTAATAVAATIAASLAAIFTFFQLRFLAQSRRDTYRPILIVDRNLANSVLAGNPNELDGKTYRTLVTRFSVKNIGAGPAMDIEVWLSVQRYNWNPSLTPDSLSELLSAADFEISNHISLRPLGSGDKEDLNEDLAVPVPLSEGTRGSFIYRARCRDIFKQQHEWIGRIHYEFVL